MNTASDPAGSPAALPLRGVLQSLLPLVLTLLAGALFLAVLDRDPLVFYSTIIERGLLSPLGLQDSIIRSAPLLLIAAGLIVAFRSGLWNLGIDGQFLLAALSSAALAPLLAPVLPLWLTLVSCLLAAMLIGALWAAVPALLKACYGINEIVTTLMMSFLGVNLANVLIKLAFRDPGTSVPQTLTLAAGERLPKMLGTSVHLGVALALAVTLLIHFLMTRTALGLRLRVIGCSPRAAVHAGLAVRRLTVVAFGLSAALAGLAGAVEILGVWGTMRTDWNPAYGLLVIPLVFLARFNGITVIAFVFLFAVIAIGGETAARRTDLPNDFVLLLVGLLLIFMALTEWLSQRLRARKAVGL